MEIDDFFKMLCDIYCGRPEEIGVNIYWKLGAPEQFS